MDLFNDIGTTTNLLPQDGVALYYSNYLLQTEAVFYWQQLQQNIEWKNDEAFIYGKHIITKRKVAWYGSKPFAYTYSKSTKNALPWTNELLQLKQKAEALTAATYNSCLLNLYHNGDEGMGWHSDDEKELVKDAAIASISLGAERKFLFKHKQTQQQVAIILQSGSLLLMKASTQAHWLHSLPKSKKITTPRINLTFRTINEQ